MTPEFLGDREAELDRLFARYRDACGSPEPRANFMPGLWQKIEARQSKSMLFARAARMLVAAGVGLSLVLGVFLALPGQQPSAFYSSSFVEALATDHTRQYGPFLEPVRLDVVDHPEHDLQ